MNWGKGITIFMIAFMAFIVSMVYYAFTMNADLVRDDYYENERKYDDEKESKFNYSTLNESVTLTQQEEGVVLQFPESVSLQSEGKIVFYRPDQKKYDREFDLKINEKHCQVLDYTNFKEGYYDVTIQWSDAGKSYICENNIQF
ncbi:MAG: FixH family protein [Bacteroidetes bacterium]|nr:FixH family protein [Bacteroidota bacterium]